MKPQRINGKTPRKPQRTNNKRSKEPVEVCARVRNLTNADEERCLTVKNDTTVRLQGPPPESRATECQFFQVFDENVGQKTLFDTVAFPMVEDLVKGKNGLLFTYGVTSSGKTYTMTGNVDKPGFLPRCLDMIFTSIGDYQANKYVFLPDGMNSFSIQSETDALQDRQERDIMPGLTKTPGKHSKPIVPALDRYDLEMCQSENVNPEYRYALFVSFVEIYNDNIYDLLQDSQLDPFNRPKPPQCKRLREDRNKDMFVYDVCQVEVKSTEEAFATFEKGQQRRKVAHTNLNAESSRGHSIFCIRLVQAPLDPLGEDLLMEKSFIISSQLCLVDLAGSERMRRTHAVGDRVKEASSINGSLMALRRCLEQLRANQKSNAHEMVKYRNSKLTHLFKSYFEGNGKVKMVVCLNPNAQEYDENCQVVQFAEVASQVEVDRSDVYRLDAAALRQRVVEAKEAKRAKAEADRKQRLTAAKNLAHEAPTSRHAAFRKHSGSGRRKTPSVSETTTTTSESETATEDAVSDWEALSYHSVPQFPDLQLLDSSDSNTLMDIISVVRERLGNRNSYNSTIGSIRSTVRTNLNALYQSDQDVHQRLLEAEKNLSLKQKEIEKMERNMKKLESKNQVLTRTTQVFEKDKQVLQDQLNTAEGQVKSQKREVRKLESQMRGAVATTKAQAEKEYEKKVREAQLTMQEKMLAQNEKFAQLKSIIGNDGREGRAAKRNHITARKVVRPSITPMDSTHTTGTSRSSRYHRRRSRSAENLLSDRSRLDKSISKTSTKATSTANLSKPRSSHVELPKPAKNERGDGKAPPIVHKHRRSASGSGPWLEHRPDTTVSTETILQPRIRAKVVSVPSPKDVAGASKYLLTHQSEDRDGEIETQLVKGEVFHTRTGGQQVQFVDIETLKQSDPQKDVTPPQQRKRKSSVESEPDTWTDVETRCSYGIGNNLNAERPTSASSKRKK